MPKFNARIIIVLDIFDHNNRIRLFDDLDQNGTENQKILKALMFLKIKLHKIVANLSNPIYCLDQFLNRSKY